MKKKIGCVVILYNPDLVLLKKAIDSAYGQVEHIIMIDNSKSNLDSDFYEEYPAITYRRLSDNMGIATAQNVGIRFFIEQNYDFVINLDQDSIMEEHMVERLLEDYDVLTRNGILVGAIGPRPFNRYIEEEYRGRVMKGKLILPNITEVTEIISSASLVPIENYSHVGFMDEILFIDGVDHEWCWRGKLHKFRFFISENASLSHQLGEGDKFFVVRPVAIPTSFRVYYQYRNYFLLIRRSYVPLYWKLANGFKYFIKAFYYPLALENGKSYFRNIVNGSIDGIFKNMKRNIIGVQ